MASTSASTDGAAVGPAGSDWMSALFARLRERDRAERDPFVGVFGRYASLLDEQDSLRRQNADLRRRRFVAQADTPGGTGGQVETVPQQQEQRQREREQQSEEVTRLASELRAVREELTNSYRVKAENAEAMLRLKQQAEESERALIAKEQELEVRKEELRAAEAGLESERDRAAKLESAVELLHGEVGTLRSQVEQCGDRIRELSNDNTALLDRIMTMKNQQAAEMNQMNEMYEKAARNAKAAEETLRAHREQSAASADAAAGADLDFSDGSSILDAVAWQGHFNVKLPDGPSRRVPAHEGQASGVRFNAGGTLAVSCGADTLVRLWDARSGQSRATLRGAKQGVVCASFSADGRMVLGSGNDRSALVWAVSTSRVLHTLTGHTGKIYASVFSVDGRHAVTGSHDRSIRVWDMSNGYSLRTFSCGSSCNYMSLGPNGDLLASAHMDKHVRFWSLRTGEAVADVEQLHTQQATCAEFSSDGNMVVTASRDNSLRLLDARTYKPVATLREEKNDYRNTCNWGRACFSPDGQYVAAGSGDGSIFVWSAKDGTLKGHARLGAAAGPAGPRRRASSSGAGGAAAPEAATCLAWNRNGRQLVSTHNSGEMVLWE